MPQCLAQPIVASLSKSRTGERIFDGFAHKLVRSGLGISIVPSLTLFHFQHPGVVTRPLAWSALRRRIYLVHRRDRSLSIAAQTLRDLAVARQPAEDASKQPSPARRARHKS